MKLRKTGTQDLHPSIKMMIKNKSTNQVQQGGELGENFLSLYNSKTHWGLDI